MQRGQILPMLMKEPRKGSYKTEPMYTTGLGVSGQFGALPDPIFIRSNVQSMAFRPLGFSSPIPLLKVASMSLPGAFIYLFFFVVERQRHK